MSEVIDMQGQPEPEVPNEEKASNVSYQVCHNSYQSQAFCWRW